MKFPSILVSISSGVAFAVLTTLLRVHGCHIPVLAMPVLGLLKSKLSEDNRKLLVPTSQEGERTAGCLQESSQGFPYDILPTPAQMFQSRHSDWNSSISPSWETWGCSGRPVRSPVILKEAQNACLHREFTVKFSERRKQGVKRERSRYPEERQRENDERNH